MKLHKFRNFYLLWSGSIISKLGDNINDIAISIWILTNTNSPLLMGITYIFPKIVRVIFSIFSGNFIDKYNKKTILVFSDFSRGVISLTIALIIYSNLIFNYKIIILCILLTFSSIFDSLFQPASQSIIPEIVLKSIVHKANSLFHISDNFLSIIGTILASSIVIFIGIIPAIIFNCISFFISAIAESLLNYNPVEVKKNKEKNILFMISEGINYVYQQKFIFIIILCAGIMNFLYVPIYQNILNFALKNIIEKINFQTKIFSFTMKNSLAIFISIYSISFALGSIIAGIKVNSIKEHVINRRYFLLPIFLSSLSSFVFGILFFKMLNNNLNNIIFISFFSICSMVNGICISLFSISLITLIQTKVKEEFLGRVFSFRMFLSGILNPLGMFVISIIANRLKIYYVYFFLHSILALLVFLSLNIYTKKKNLLI